MRLEPGTAIGGYVVLSHLGSGGMGDVYRAEDTRLGREVALKVLNTARAGSPAAEARQEQEARVLASLNHPGIAAIYGIEEFEDRQVLVLELVPGENLAERLARGPLPLPEALRVAGEIARALEAAHAAGVVHRDLKPANVKIRPDGRISVLDFGLAKVMRGPGISGSQDATLAATLPGTVMGTPSYMSPEQAGGRSVDGRTDIWSLGVLLFECLAGESAFPGRTVAEAFAAILERSPAWERLPEATPLRVRTLLERALQKEPAGRWPAARDLRLALEAALEDTRPRRTKEIRLTQETFDEAIESAPAWSPDGTRLAFCREAGPVRKIFVKTAGLDDAKAVTRGDHDDIQPAWMDDRTLLFVRSRQASPRLTPGDLFGSFDGGDVWSVDLGTGAETRLIDRAFHPAPRPGGGGIAVDASWAGPRRIWLVDAHGRNPQQVTSDTSEAVSHLRPRWDPRGTRIVFQNVERTRINVRTVDLHTRDLQWLTNDVILNVEPSWSPRGDSVYFSSYRAGGINLWSIPVDPAGRAAGPLSQVTSGAGPDIEAAMAPDATRLAFTIMKQNAALWRLPVDPASGRATGEPEKVVASSRESSRGAWSPDGRRIAFNSDRSGTMNIWLHDLESGATRRLTEGAGGDYQPTWSPDGRHLVFFSSRNGHPGLWTVEVETGGLRHLSEGGAMEVNPFFSPDGRHIAYQGDRDGRLEVWVRDADGANPRQLTRIGVMGHFLRWTGDGRHVIFRTSSEGSRLFRVPFGGGDPEPLPPVKGGSHLSLSPDGSLLMDVIEHRTLWASPLDGGEPHRVYEFQDPDVRIDYPVWSPDGTWVLFDRLRPQGGDVWVLEERE